MTGIPRNPVTLNSLSLDDTQNSPSTSSQLIPQLRDSLKTFLERLKVVPSIDAVNTRTLLGCNAGSSSLNASLPGRVVLNPEADELDESIVGLLTYIGSQFSVWIFDDFINSGPLKTTLWTSFFYYTIKSYQQAVLGKSNVAETEPYYQQACYIENERFISMCQTITYYYKNLITRMIEKFGNTPQIHYVVSCLRLKPDEHSVHSNVNQKILPVLHLSIHDALCHMGDLSRYRASLEDQSTRISSNYSHALIYYTTASKISPSSGVPLNQLGNISYFRGDFFTATYYFLRSVAVDEPFKEVSNLRLILRKLSKVKGNALADSPIYGLTEQNFDTPEEFYKVKKTLLQITQLYSNIYLAQVNGKNNVSKQSSIIPLEEKEMEALQNQLSEDFYECCKNRDISSRILVNLVIISIIFTWLLKKTIDQSDDKPLRPKSATVLLTPLKAYRYSLSFSLKLYNKLFSIALKHTLSRSGGDNMLPSQLAALLPVFRIIFDWIHKQLADDSIADWGQDGTECNALFLRAWQIVDYLHKKYKFSFDISTAVARSNWDRFDDVLKQQSDNVSKASQASSDDNEMVDPDSFGNTWGISGSKAMLENYEETHSFGLLPLNGGLSDAPTGLEVLSSLQRPEQNTYRLQCILFSAIEISRLPVTFLNVDEFKGNDATFDFEPIEFDDPAFLDDSFEEEEEQEEREIDRKEPEAPAVATSSKIPKQPKLPPAPKSKVFGEGYSAIPTQPAMHSYTQAGQYNAHGQAGQYNLQGQDEQVIDESEYYKIKRNNKGIIKEPFFNHADQGYNNGAYNGDYMGKYPAGFNSGYSNSFSQSLKNHAANGAQGSQDIYGPMKALTSASPAFLSKLYDLEKAQFTKKGGRGERKIKSAGGVVGGSGSGVGYHVLGNYNGYEASFFNRMDNSSNDKNEAFGSVSNEVGGTEGDSTNVKSKNRRRRRPRRRKRNDKDNGGALGDSMSKPSTSSGAVETSNANSENSEGDSDEASDEEQVVSHKGAESSRLVNKVANNSSRMAEEEDEDDDSEDESDEEVVFVGRGRS